MNLQQIVESILLGCTVWWALDSLKFVISRKFYGWTDFVLSHICRKTARPFRYSIRAVTFFSIVSLIAAVYVTFIDKTYTLYILQIGMINAFLCPIVDIKLTRVEYDFYELCGKADQEGWFDELMKRNTDK